jgi:hypothetical protein
MFGDIALMLDQRIAAAGQPADGESYYLGSANMAGWGVRGPVRPAKASGPPPAWRKTRDGGGMPGRVQVGSTVGPARVPLMGTPQKRLGRERLTRAQLGCAYGWTTASPKHRLGRVDHLEGGAEVCLLWIDSHR